MDRFGQDARDLLRQGPVLSRGPAAEGLLQFIGYISADEHSFAIGHFFRGLLVKSDATNGTHQRPRRRCGRYEVNSERARFAGYLPCQMETGL